MITLWRRRWSESSRVTRFGFWLTLVPAVLGLMATGLWVASDYSGLWNDVSDILFPVMYTGMLVQVAGHVRDRRERRRVHP